YNYAEKRAPDTLTLPFVDDFSYEGPYPDPSRWLERDVYINDNYPTNKLSYGVATFDGLNEYGLPYNDNSLNVYGPADTLTSQPINLQGFDAADSVFLSFAYEPKGIGDKPEELDSLILEFRLIDTVWQQIWASPGSDSAIANPQFQRVLIHITNPFYFNDAFQFRFRNMATITGNNDHWHLDYVYLDKDRSITDTLIRDLTVLNPVSNFLKNYTSMPWSHFNNNPSEADDNVLLSYRNNNVSPRNMKFSLEVTGNLSQSAIFDTSQSFFPFPPFSEFSKDYLTSFFIPFASAPVNDDSVIITLKSTCDFFTTDITMENDTVYQDVEFLNYFAYDDGTAERAYGVEGQGLKKFAYMFKLNHPDTLRAVQFHFSQINQNLSLNEFTLMVWGAIDLDNDGEGEDTLYVEERTPFQYLPMRNGFALYVLDTPLLIQDSFYIGWQQLITENVQLGLDLNNIATQHMFYYSSGTWKSSLVEGAPMLRPVVGKKLRLSTGTEDDEWAGRKFLLFPNPAGDFIELKHQGGAQQIHIYDMQGRLVKRLIHYSGRIDISDLRAGLYCIRAGVKSRFVTLKFIKQ
ncbi:MAG TPA: T9SS type A sorting domain-containing protein, partial [Chitinophagales bacterium]|nr:T9SS type A sorting domain-containing protein [Chitinophagales bacterium]